MNIRKFTLLCFAAASAMILLMTACKTSEANYRKAYEKAIVGRDSATAFENTIYGNFRRTIESSVATAHGDTVEMIRVRVKVTKDGGGIREYLKKWNVVAGGFKQLFNAKSLRERLVDAGYPRSFIVETGEPYYYIVVGSYPTEEEAVKACTEIREMGSEFPIVLRDGMPIVLYTPL